MASLDIPSGPAKDKQSNMHEKHGNAESEEVQRRTGTNGEDWQLGKTLCESLLYLQEQKLWTDVSFRCKNHDVDDSNDRIRAHKIILASRSPVFQAMLYGPYANGKEEIELLTVEAEIFALALKHMYSDVTDLTEEVVFKVLEVAHMYQLSGLVRYCSNFMMSILRADNALEILELAFFYNVKELVDAACDVIDDNAHEVLRSQTFMHVSKACFDLILKSDTLFEDELEIVKAAEHWAKHQLAATSMDISGPEVRKFLGEGFYQLRVPTLTISEFSKFSKGKGYYSVDEIEAIIEQIGDASEVDSVACHRAVKRKPRHQTLKLPPDDGLNKLSVEVIQCIMLLKVKKDCFLNGITINEVQLLRTNWEYQTILRVCVALNGILSIEGVFKHDFQINSCESIYTPKTKDLPLNTPVLLTAREIPYTLKIKLRLRFGPSPYTMCIGENPLKKLLNNSGKCTGNVHTEDCKTNLYGPESTRTDVLSIACCKESEHAGIITSIDIGNLSFRNALTKPGRSGSKNIDRKPSTRKCRKMNRKK